MPDSLGPYLLPEEEFERSILKRCIFTALTENLSFHHEIKGALTEAGFQVWRIRKHEIHDVWEIRLERGPQMFNDSYVQIRRRIRHA